MDSISFKRSDRYEWRIYNDGDIVGDVCRIPDILKVEFCKWLLMWVHAPDRSHMLAIALPIRSAAASTSRSPTWA